MNFYKVVHIFPYNLYTKAFLQFVNENYHISEHLFFIYGEKRDEAFEIGEYENVITVKNTNAIVKNKKYILTLRKAEKIIFHTNNRGVTKLLLQKPNWIKKTYLVFWGFDIYGFATPADGIKSKILRWISKCQIRNVKGICTLADQDYLKLEENVGTMKGKHFLAKYFISTDFSFRNLLREKAKNNKECCILLGNSATESNRHFEIIDKLRKYENETFKIICPLSYGAEEYRKRVVSYGKEVFGDRFIPLTQLLPLEKYEEEISKCSIGVFNTNRQQGMGNIEALLWFGGKVYIERNTTMWNHFNVKGYRVYDIQEIGESEWNEIIAYSDDESNMNYEISLKNQTDQIKIDIWDKIFEDR